MREDIIIGNSRGHSWYGNPKGNDSVIGDTEL